MKFADLWSAGPLGIQTQEVGNPEVMARFVRRARRYAVRTTRKVTLGAALLVLCMWLFIAWSLWSERTQALEHGRRDGLNLTAAFAEQLTHTLDTINAAMDVIIRRIPVSVSGEMRIDDLAEWSKDVPGIARPTRYFGLISADGKLLYTNIVSQTAPADVSDREYFSIHRDRRDVGLYISPPLVGRVSKQPMIRFTKRIETADGKFAGVLIFLAPPVELARLRDRIDLGNRGVLAVIGTDHVVRVRVSADHPDGSFGLGVVMKSGSWPDDLAPGASGSFRRVGQVDPIERLYSYRRLEKYPLIVNVALDIDDVLGEVWQHLWLLGAIGLAMSGLIAGLAMLLAREIWRRTLREIELAAERGRLEAARAEVLEERNKLSKANTELVASVQRAERANQAKSQFLAHMSHELRTPLHAIIGFSEIIRDRAPRAGGVSPLGEYASDILASGRHLLELINAILDLSKVESGTEQISENKVRLADIIRSSVVAVGGRAGDRHIAIHVVVPADIPPLRADATKLRQVMMNLLSNAVKFTTEGGRITVSARLEASGAMVVGVQDTGIGMTDAELTIALQPFGQVDSSLSRNFEGTGLGLPLAQRLVELHGGELRITSVKGKGTLVEVCLPAERVLGVEAVQ